MATALPALQPDPVRIDAELMQTLCDALADVVFFVKDEAGRYTHANLTLVRRLGLKRREEVIGRDVAEVFPARLAARYAQQDRRVLDGGTIENQLEVHLYPNRRPGWCLTGKRPLALPDGGRGLVGLSRDLGAPDGRDPTYERLRRVLEHMQAHYAGPLRIAALARLADLSVAQLERHFQRVFQLTPQQSLTRLRIEAAMRELCGDASIAEVGLACGFTDQSAFARQFKAMVGMAPRDYRALHRGGQWGPAR
ncbi:transcriptional regulator, AraC family [Lysobacter enzymogenes]|uniref:Transcriptional regulator, AraC family n=2 Tax=Lysobacter TaxID=68 RepID=A0A0S2DN09_LYSEN|nr:transcriptional regulator, AraC family [Lysobacter enzymogenes]